MSDFVVNSVWDPTQFTRKRIYIIWLLLDLNFRSTIAMKVKFISYDVLKVKIF